MGEFLGLQGDLEHELGFGTRITLLSSFTEGRSGCAVWTVDIVSPRFSGIAILKAAVSEPAITKLKAETAKLEEALAGSPASFAELHIPTRLLSLETQRGAALMVSVAGSSLHTVATLGSLGSSQLPNAFASVSAGLLDGWNPDYEWGSDTVTLRQQLLSFLGEKHTSRLLESAVHLPEWLSASEPAFSIHGRWLPNPLHLLAQGGSSPAYNSRNVLGRTHGDLHCQNVLTKIGSREDVSFYLIDFSRYAPRVPLFFDSAYLELSFLLDARKTVGARDWLGLVSVLAARDPECVQELDASMEDVGVIRAVRAIRDAERAWQDKAEPNRRDPVAVQLLLSRVAAGLDFAGKDIPEVAKQKAFVFAAAHLGALYERISYEWVREGPSISAPTRGADLPNSDWQEVLRACESFDKRRSLFALIVGPGLRDIEPRLQAALGALPFSVVFDFDPSSRQSGFLGASRDEFLARRDLSLMTAETVREWNPQKSVAFMLADGADDVPTTRFDEFTRWRREYMPLIRGTFAKALKMAAPLSPVTILVLPDGIEERKLEACVDGLDEVLGERAGYVIIDSEPRGQPSCFSGLNAKAFNIRREALLAVISDAFRQLSVLDTPVIPSRSAGAHNLQRLTTQDLRFVEQDLELVYAGLGSRREADRALAKDFWRGHTISWADLAAGGVDVPRDLFERQDSRRASLEELIVQHLKHSGVTRVILQHTPGAGGTTAARRLAWDVKERYPTVVVTAMSGSTAARIGFLFHTTAYPILVVVEAAVCPSTQLDELERRLARDKISCVLLYVVRSLHPTGDFILVDPLSPGEAVRFLQKYSTVALPGKVNALKRLATGSDMLQYRSPFFFGLLAFEREYAHVLDFVSAHIDGLDGPRREALTYLALVTRYGQVGLTPEELHSLLGVLPGTRPQLAEILGDGPSRMVLVEDTGVRLLHPLLAEAVLRLLLGLPGRAADDWRFGLENVCVSFIERLAAVYDAVDAGESPPVLEQIFTGRPHMMEESFDTGAYRKTFSELVQRIPGEGSQSRVLSTLARCFPENPHFQMHLGRHYMYVMEDFVQAEVGIRKAIELEDPHDCSIHYHALGMLFRLRAKAHLARAKTMKHVVEETLPEVQSYAREAFEAFRASRALAPDNAYSYVTAIQLTAELVEGLYRLTPFRDMSAFWRDRAPAVDWCRELMADAEELLDRLMRIQAHFRSMSSRTLDCRRRLVQSYGNSAATIEVLDKLLARPDVRHESVRRLLANAYIVGSHHDWEQLAPKDLERIRNLMEANLRSGAANGHDVRRWLSAARRLDSFDSLDAISKLENWAARDNDNAVEAHFYLYILRFLRWLEGLTADSSGAMSDMARCEACAGDYGRTFLREWLSAERRTLPLLESREIGWIGGSELAQPQAARLRKVEGRIRQIIGPQAGFLAVGPFPVFFLPGTGYVKGRDEETRVRVNIGFSYEGVRAFNPERDEPGATAL